MNKLFPLIFLSFNCCFAQVAVQQDTSVEKGQILSTINALTDAVNSGQGDLGSFWTDDAEIINPLNGQAIDGNAAVSEYLLQKQAGMQGKKISFEANTVTFDAPDQVTIEGIATLTDNGKIVDRQARKVELVKENGKWLLDTLSEIPVQLAPSISYDHLKELDWLMGKGIEQDENSSNTYETTWDKYKNFLIQKFNMKIYGVDAIEGRQIIGWDPYEGKIRSWIFDSDGGYGSGLWTKTPEGWSVRINYMLSDGKRAQSTNFYSKITNNSYNFSSVDRVVDGAKLPDIEQVTVTKEAP